MPSQTEAGKAFEYALLISSTKKLSSVSYEVIENASYVNAQNCFSLFSDAEKLKYTRAADAAIDHISYIEPRLLNPVSDLDILTLQIVSDSEGIRGDVRDIIFSRPLQNWSFGISAKNNHKAVKHSRLSESINFGKDWLNLNCSEAYFDSIKPIFTILRQLKAEGKKWRELKDKHLNYYVPVLNSFIEELQRLDAVNPGLVPSALIKYLIGHHDFYKVIKRKGKTEIYGFHFSGGLNKASQSGIKPLFRVNKLKLPLEIIKVYIKSGSTDTVILNCDEGWQLSFRIHNASSDVEPSLKFDINLVGQPPSLYSHHLNW